MIAQEVYNKVKLQREYYKTQVDRLDILIRMLNLLHDDASWFEGQFLSFAKMKEAYPPGERKIINGVLVESFEAGPDKIQMVGENISDEEKTIPLHAHDCNEHIKILQGGPCYQIIKQGGNVVKRIPITGSVLIPAGEWHEVAVPTNTRYEILLIR